MSCLPLPSVPRFSSGKSYDDGKPPLASSLFLCEGSRVEQARIEPRSLDRILPDNPLHLRFENLFTH